MEIITLIHLVLLMFEYLKFDLFKIIYYLSIFYQHQIIINIFYIIFLSFINISETLFLIMEMFHKII